MATVICRRSGLAPELPVNLGILAEVWMIDTLIRRPTTSGASDVPSKCPIYIIRRPTRVLTDSTLYRSKQSVWSTHITEVVVALVWQCWARICCNANKTIHMKVQTIIQLAQLVPYSIVNKYSITLLLSGGFRVINSLFFRQNFYF